jgi:hypothetical protein
MSNVSPKQSDQKRTINLSRGIIVDDQDLPLLDAHLWTVVTGRNYAHRKPNSGPAIWLHRLISRCPPGMQCDHINGNRLDNRRANLRNVTARQNAQNLHKLRGTSGFRGVSFHRASGKWGASGMRDQKTYHLGLFDTRERAAEVARKWRSANLPFAVEIGA